MEMKQFIQMRRKFPSADFVGTIMLALTIHFSLHVNAQDQWDIFISIV